MANWQGVREGLIQGAQLGAATGGKRAGLGSAIKKIADRLRQEREMGEEVQKNILGLVTAQGIKNIIDPSAALSQMELEEARRRKAGLTEPTTTPTALGQLQVSPITQPTTEEATEVPTMQDTVAVGEKTTPETPAFIQIQDGVDKYGNSQFKTVKNPQYELLEKQKEGKITAKGEVLKLSEKSKANFGRAVSMFSTLVSAGKGMAEEQEGLGLAPGIKGGLATWTKRPGYGRAAAFRGQLRETAISLNSILTGQNRVIRSVVQMIQETLPDAKDPEDMFATKISQSITNAYKLVKAFDKAGYSSETLQSMPDNELNKIDAKGLVGLYTLNPEEETELQTIIDDVLSAQTMPKRSFIRKNEPLVINSIQEVR